MTVTVALGHVNELRASRAGEYRGHFGHGSLIMKQHLATDFYQASFSIKMFFEKYE